jgi:6-pyruvoyltetrahydropterin/6-carboxytetrahydropterin synthase
LFRVTRRYRFAASHRLHAPQLSEDANRELYGKCNNPYGHGHNYVVDVSAQGPADEAGRAVDLQALDELVRRRVLAQMEHRDLNSEVEPFAREVPTSENLAREVCRRLKTNWREAFPGEWPKLEKVRIGETRKNAFEITADEIE